LPTPLARAYRAPVNAISRYLLRQLLFATAMVAGILTLLVVLLRSLGLVDLVINRGASFGTLAEMTVYLAPPIIAQLLPIGLVAGVLFTFARLNAERELVVMRAAGMSQLDLARPVLALALLVSLACFSITLYFGPVSQQAYRELQFAARSGLAQLLVREGRFNTPLDRVTVYVRVREQNGDLRGIIVHDARNRQRPTTWMAESGRIVMTEAGPQVVMFNGNRQEVGASAGQLTLVYFERGAIDIAALDPALGYRPPSGGERFLPQLFDPEPEVGARRNTLFVEGLRRIATPLLPFGYALIALAALLTGDLNRRGQTLRIVAAIGATVALQLADAGIASLATGAPATRPLIFATPFGAAAFGLWLLVRRPRNYVARLRQAIAPAVPG
jgi:lipopolysaccharide export system permease protein